MRRGLCWPCASGDHDACTAVGHVCECACPTPPVDRYAHPDRAELVHSPVVEWRPSAPAPLSSSYLAAVARYLERDHETPAQQRGAS